MGALIARAGQQREEKSERVRVCVLWRVVCAALRVRVRETERGRERKRESGCVKRRRRVSTGRAGNHTSVQSCACAATRRLRVGALRSLLDTPQKATTSWTMPYLLEITRLQSLRSAPECLP